MPNNNEDHVSLTSANVSFALSEILNSSASVQDISQIKFQLENNPIKDNIIIVTNNNNQDAIITVFDLTGKNVLRVKVHLQYRTTIPINLNPGFYILNLSDYVGNYFTTKFIINK